MKLGLWMAAKAVVEVVFGIGFVLVPTFLASLFGMDPGPAGILMARLFGTAFIFGSIVLWHFRDVPTADLPGRSIVIGVALTNAIGFVVTLLACIAGTWNALGWLPVALYLVFGLVFGYSLLRK